MAVAGKLTNGEVFLTTACAETVAVGDCVYSLGASVDTSDPSDIDTMPSIGVVVTKLTATTCKVQLSGILKNLSGLTPNKQVFVAPDGTLTDTVPTSGLVQFMGIAIDATSIHLSPPEQALIKLI